MSFDDITSGLQRAWSFLVPAIVRLASVLAVSYYIAPAFFSRAAKAIAQLADPTFITDQKIQAALEFYGLSKIMPVAFAILVIALLEFAQRLVLWIGGVIPPSIVTSQPALFIATAMTPEIKKLWQRHRAADSLNSLRSLLEARVESLEMLVRKNFDYWTLTQASAYRLFSTSKFLALWSLGIAAAAKPVEAQGGELSRALILMPALGACSLYAIIKYLYSCMQREYSVVNAMLAVEPAAPEEGSAGSMTDDQIDEALKFDPRHRMRWWELRLIDSSMAKWTWEQLTRRI